MRRRVRETAFPLPVLAAPALLEASIEMTMLAASASEMRELGQRLGRLLEVGDVVGLVGPLGAGKTTFAQGMARGLEVPVERHVASPTFALVNQHPGRVPFVHADLYRINDVSEITELGLAEVYEYAAAAIEWLDRFPGAAPDDRLEVVITPDFDSPGGGGARRIVARGTGPRGAALAAAWAGGGRILAGAAAGVDHGGAGVGGSVMDGKRPPEAVPSPLGKISPESAPESAGPATTDQRQTSWSPATASAAAPVASPSYSDAAKAPGGRSK
jgi:tRNA threonylcarbamoyladenosine biosynthesis protein TsaE